MQLHQIKRRTKNKKRAAVGRGGRRGKTSGRGTKGQKARAGHKLRPELRDIIKRLPKIRGRGKNSFKSITEKPFVINIDRLVKIFEKGEAISPESLTAKGIVRMVNSRSPRIKILGDGEATKALTIVNCQVSLPAKIKIEKAGGSIS
jgi:large subunit ribosomal protein L15